MAEAKVKIKEQKEKDIELDNKKYKIKWKEKEITFEKTEAGTKGKEKLKVDIKKDEEGAKWEEGKEAEVEYDKGFWSHAVVIKKVDSKDLKEPLKPGVKGFKTQGIIVMIVLAVALVAILIGLWYWMTKKSPEDEE